MASPRLPRGFATVNTSDHADVFRMYAPDFKQNIALGYVNSATVNPYLGHMADLVAANGKLLAQRGYLGPAPRDYQNGRPQPETVQLASTSALDVSFVVIVGTDVFGENRIEIMWMQGITPIWSEYHWLSISRVIYAPRIPSDGQTENVGTITVGNQTNPYTTVIMRPGMNFGTNAVLRAPKWMKTILGTLHMHVRGGSGVEVHIEQNNYPDNLGWGTAAIHVIGEGNGKVDLSGQISLEEGDLWAINVINPNNPPSSFWWSMDVTEVILDDAPPDYVPVVAENWPTRTTEPPPL